MQEFKWSEVPAREPMNIRSAPTLEGDEFVKTFTVTPLVEATVVPGLFVIEPLDLTEVLATTMAVLRMSLLEFTKRFTN